MSRIRSFCSLGLFVAFSATAAFAQDSGAEAQSGLGFGLKAGIGFNPTQALIGAQVSLGKSLGIFRLVPNGHVGFGDHTTGDVSVDFLLRLISQDANFGIYAGAAPTLVFSDDTDFGATAVAGLQVPLIPNRATNLEGRIGIGRVPDFRLLLTLIL